MLRVFEDYSISTIFFISFDSISMLEIWNFATSPVALAADCTRRYTTVYFIAGT